ncbi:MAG: hypothetical protein ACXAC2_00390 [Candidatus Kariarchaeaceae archaeon]|jgi:hypothetical protein
MTIDVEDPAIWSKTDVFLNNERMTHVYKFTMTTEVNTIPKFELFREYLAEDCRVMTKITFHSFMYRIEQIHDGIAFHITSDNYREELIGVEEHD